MKSSVVAIIKIIALIMFVLGVFFLIYSSVQLNYVSSSYYMRDEAPTWYIMLAGSIYTIVSSILVLGFSYIVEAASIYIDKNKVSQEEEE